jgi:hypothetical protein
MRASIAWPFGSVAWAAAASASPDSGSPAASLGFMIPNAPVSPPEGWLARLRIDDIESPIIDLSQPPPATPTFLNQRVVIT